MGYTWEEYDYPQNRGGWRGHTLAAGLAFAILRLGLMLATVQMSRPLARSDRSPITTVYYKLACDRIRDGVSVT